MIASLCSEEPSETGGHHRTGSAAEFYRELNRRCASDLDLEQVIQASRQPNSGITL